MKELAVRTISGVIFVALTLASLIIVPKNPLPFIILFSFYLIRTVYEYLRLTMGKGRVVMKVLTILAALCVFIIGIGYTVGHVYVPIEPYCLPLLVLIFLAVPIVDLYSKDGGGFEFVWSSLTYIALPFALLPAVCAFSYGFDGWVIASLLIIMWMGDVGAYCIGTAFGQGEHGHKLMPSVSPKKSWEGVFGAVVISVITAVVLRAFNLLLPDYEYWLSALFGLLISIFSIFGDLVESKLKRRFQVKDSGRIMPGHGGFLDRFDSGLLAFPVAAVFYFILFLL